MSSQGGEFGPGTSALTVLQRIARSKPPPPPGERCEMCAEPVAAAHSHVVSVTSRELMCACRACYLLFTAPGAQLKYLAVPERYLSFPSFGLTRLQWDDLQIPVGMAFFFLNSQLGRTVAFYPSPAGATESELSLTAWEEIRATNPELGTLTPDVEALLLRASIGTESTFDCYLVPIDACYELVGQLRKLWRGFDGGSAARDAVDRFFAGIRARSRPAPAHPAAVTSSPVMERPA